MRYSFVLSRRGKEIASEKGDEKLEKVLSGLDAIIAKEKKEILGRVGKTKARSDLLWR